MRALTFGVTKKQNKKKKKKAWGGAGRGTAVPGRSNGSIPGRSRGPDARSVEAFRAALPRGPDATREAFRAAPAARTLAARRVEAFRGALPRGPDAKRVEAFRPAV